MYKSFSIVMFRVLALYFLTSALGTLALVLPYAAAPTWDEAARYSFYSQFLYFALQALFSGILWFGAPFFSRRALAKIQDINDVKIVGETDNVCAAILAAAGFLILAMSFPTFSYWIPTLFSQPVNLVLREASHIFQSITYILLGLFLIFRPGAIWATITKMRKV